MNEKERIHLSFFVLSAIYLTSFSIFFLEQK
nr:MAG TPA: hypothetical protein [Caudoviricetes sp.]